MNFQPPDNDDPRDDDQRVTDAKAYERGSKDFARGSHANPFLYDVEGSQFRAWIAGYNDAKILSTWP